MSLRRATMSIAIGENLYFPTCPTEADHEERSRPDHDNAPPTEGPIHDTTVLTQAVMPTEEFHD